MEQWWLAFEDNPGKKGDSWERTLAVEASLQENPNALVVDNNFFLDDDRVSEMRRGGGDKPKGCGAGTIHLHDGVLW